MYKTNNKFLLITCLRSTLFLFFFTLVSSDSQEYSIQKNEQKNEMTLKLKNTDTPFIRYVLNGPHSQIISFDNHFTKIDTHLFSCFFEEMKTKRVTRIILPKQGSFFNTFSLYYELLIKQFCEPFGCDYHKQQNGMRVLSINDFKKTEKTKIPFFPEQTLRFELSKLVQNSSWFSLFKGSFDRYRIVIDESAEGKITDACMDFFYDKKLSTWIVQLKDIPSEIKNQSILFLIDFFGYIYKNEDDASRFFFVQEKETNAFQLFDLEFLERDNQLNNNKTKILDYYNAHFKRRDDNRIKPKL